MMLVLLPEFKFERKFGCLTCHVRNIYEALASKKHHIRPQHFLPSPATGQSFSVTSTPLGEPIEATIVEATRQLRMNKPLSSGVIVSYVWG